MRGQRIVAQDSLMLRPTVVNGTCGNCAQADMAWSRVELRGSQSAKRPGGSRIAARSSSHTVRGSTGAVVGTLAARHSLPNA